MNKTLPILLFLSLLTHTISTATIYAPRATSIDSLIGSSDIVVKGTLELVGQKSFMGYKPDGSDYTIDEVVRERGIPLDIARHLVMPLVEYQVMPVEIFKGEPENPIILRVMIPQLTNHLDNTLGNERMFMLIRNHQGNSTYGTMSFDAIMELDSENRYRVAALSADETGVILELPPFLSPEESNSSEFENLVRERISARQ